MPAGGGQAVLVLPHVQWMKESADGAHFFYAERGRASDVREHESSFAGFGLWKVPAAGGEPVPVMKISSPIWTLSGSGIYILDPHAEGGPAIEFFPFAGNRRPEMVRLGGVPEDYFFTYERLDVSADGRWLVYSYRDRTEADIMLVENFR